MLSFLMERKSLQDRYFITGIGLFFSFPPNVENNVEKWKTIGSIYRGILIERR